MDIRVLEMPEFTPFVFNNSQVVYENMALYGKADREIFLTLSLSAKNQVIKREVLSIGTVDQTAVYPREIYKSALLNRAASIVCVHNHPSGDSAPSFEDDDITRKLLLGGMLLGIKFLDHIIIGKGSYYSYADEGRIDEFESAIKKLLRESNILRF